MTIVPWQETLDGNFAQAFVDTWILPEKISHRQPQSFERSSSNCMGNNEVPFEVRQTLVDIVLAWTHDYAEGVSK